MGPKTQYAETADGVSIASRPTGHGPLVVVPTWVSLLGWPGARVHELEGVSGSPRLFAVS